MHGSSPSGEGKIAINGYKWNKNGQNQNNNFQLIKRLYSTFGQETKVINRI